MRSTTHAPTKPKASSNNCTSTFSLKVHIEKLTMINIMDTATTLVRRFKLRLDSQSRSMGPISLWLSKRACSLGDALA